LVVSKTKEPTYQIIGQYSKAHLTGIVTLKDVWLGLGHFGDADSAMERFCHGTFRRWWSQMFHTKKSVFLKYLNRCDYKGCLLNKRFCCHPEGRCGFSSARSLETFSAIVRQCDSATGRQRDSAAVRQCDSATVNTRGRKYGLWRFFLLARGVCEFTQKLSVDSIFCFNFAQLFWLHFTDNLRVYSLFLSVGCLSI